jgi:tetratricopeptide (TPR) repeat protein
MASEALPAARRYAQIAPASPHAIHMPSHIFARLGLWQDDIQSNLASKAMAEEQHATADRLHAMNFLEYAYLQLGEHDQAKALEEEAIQVPHQDYSKDMSAFFFYVQVRFPTLYSLETKSWKDIQRLPVSTDEAPDVQAVIYWAKAIAAAHLREVNEAEKSVADYDAALDAVRKSSYAYVADEMATSHDEAHGWLAFVHGNIPEATRLLTRVADEQDRDGKGEVEIPAREMLADMLLEANQPQEAFVQYALSLKTDPNRFNSLYGAAHAAELAHRPADARSYYAQLLAGRNVHPPSAPPELLHAGAYVTGGVL